jgi:cation:H+ antiporter
VALWAAEELVSGLDALGHRVHLSAALLGTLVAFGADGPEVTSALLALASGSQDVGAGVLIGSNIYNLAGLLGLSAILAGPLPLGVRGHLNLEEILNVALTALAVLLVFLSPLHIVFGLLSLALFAAYLLRIGHPLHTRSPEDDDVPTVSGRALAARLSLSMVLIVVGSDVLVRASLYLGPRLGIPPSIIGTVVLAVATSLPNTWAAVSLARRGRSAAAVAATFSSNSINLVIGFGLPAVFITPHLPSFVRFDVLWLSGMSVVAVGMMATRHALTRLEGSALVALYAGFLFLRLVFLQ